MTTCSTPTDYYDEVAESATCFDSLVGIVDLLI